MQSRGAGYLCQPCSICSHSKRWLGLEHRCRDGFWLGHLLECTPQSPQSMPSLRLLPGEAQYTEETAAVFKMNLPQAAGSLLSKCSRKLPQQDDSQNSQNTCGSILSELVGCTALETAWTSLLRMIFTISRCHRRRCTDLCCGVCLCGGEVRRNVGYVFWPSKLAVDRVRTGMYSASDIRLGPSSSKIATCHINPN